MKTYKEFYFWLEGFLSANPATDENTLNKIKKEMEKVQEDNFQQIPNILKRETIKIPELPKAPKIIC